MHGIGKIEIVNNLCFCMKRGFIGTIVLAVIGVLILSVAGVGIYFYNYHVFKEVWVCVGEGESLGIPCESRETCVGLMEEGGVDFSELDSLPDFAKRELDKIFDEVIYCDETCFVSEVRGVDLESGELVELDSCLEGEDEFVIEVNGKMVWEAWSWEKERNA